MKQVFSEQATRGVYSLLLLIGVFWVNLGQYFVHAIDADSGFEYCIPLDADSENKEKNAEDEKDDKVRTESAGSRFVFSKIVLEIIISSKLSKSFHPEIPTPPPERILTIS